MGTTEVVDESLVSVQLLHDFFPGVPVSMLRLDALHPVVSGNKWFKLKYTIQEALALNCRTLLSFGGAYSNHLIALAAAAQHAGLHSVGVVRGLVPLNDVLRRCQDYGMSLHFIDREAYRHKDHPEFLQDIGRRFPDAYLVPEGGAGQAGRKGAGEISRWIDGSYTHILLSVGTGTTFAGLRNALPAIQHMMGFAPMKGGTYLADEIRIHLLRQQDANWSLTDRFAFGGFGKITEPLAVFMRHFHEQYGFALDRVYTAKMMFGLRQLLEEKTFPEGARLLCIHTGGLTGN